ncbi:MAG: histidine phosphatase family protein [Dehalococcoidia bacterium]|nr:histidine phosphatase family protein [Dehalococcoidia bacterium]
MTLYLVRHGLAAAGVDDLDPGLDPLGHEQARHAADFLQAVNVQRVITSPLRRTRETSVPIAEALACDTVVRAEVAEVFDASMPVEQRRAMIGPFMAGRWPDQPDTLRAWREQVVACLRELAAEAHDAGRDVVAVSHYIAIGVAIGEALGDDRVVPVPMANTSITSLAFEQGKFSLLKAADVSHLPPEKVTGIHTAMMGKG